MAKLIATMGLPASGKTTLAKQLLREHSDWVHVEMDLIRQELGNEPYSEEFEKKVQQTRDERILAALRAGKTVVNSDTNLSYKTRKRLESLAEQAKAEIEWVDFTHVPVEVCIDRDSKRSAPVGKGVIMRMYSKIRPDDEVRSDRKCLLIGDVHSDYKRLLKILNEFGFYQKSSSAWYTGEWINSQGYYLVQLGDLNDPRLDDEEANRKEMSSWKCINIMKGLQEQGFAEVLQSNHQKNLIDWYYGRRKKLTWGLEYTVQEIEDYYLNPDFVRGMIDWLEARPYFYRFIEGGKEYVCAHAYYTDSMPQYQPHGEAVSRALYGIKVEELLKEGKEVNTEFTDGSRYKWWLDPDYLDDKIRIAAHYHCHGYFPSVHNTKAILLDGCCGNTGGELLAYLPGEHRMISSDDWSEISA